MKTDLQKIYSSSNN